MLTRQPLFLPVKESDFRGGHALSARADLEKTQIPEGHDARVDEITKKRVHNEEERPFRAASGPNSFGFSHWGEAVHENSTFTTFQSPLPLCSPTHPHRKWAADTSMPNTTPQTISPSPKKECWEWYPPKPAEDSHPPPDEPPISA